MGRRARSRAFSTEDLARQRWIPYRASTIKLRIGVNKYLGDWGLGKGGTILACMHRLHTAYPQCKRPSMGLFRHQKALDRLEDRLKRTEDLCADLQRDRKKLDLEFTDLYDKVRHQMSRMAKRDALAAKENGEDFTEPADATSENEIDPISAKILERRSRGFLTR